ncbi:hypothetical protein MSG28_010764 [Choristoneura fumiferana]|uniref:Uncharacterized protein n=1 Tax=Choristoneura fumiferana TaxID=7141 RepID=A0ACC0KQ23_CHOFU|nr:hypothetical protein MSG28_010764 [Choristoneura fumiferana]
MQAKLISASYSSIMNKQDLLREVVVKYIDYFYPVASGTSAVAIDNKIEQAMVVVCPTSCSHCARDDLLQLVRAARRAPVL